MVRTTPALPMSKSSGDSTSNPVRSSSRAVASSGVRSSRVSSASTLARRSPKVSVGLSCAMAARGTTAIATVASNLRYAVAIRFRRAGIRRAVEHAATPWSRLVMRASCSRWPDTLLARPPACTVSTGVLYRPASTGCHYWCIRGQRCVRRRARLGALVGTTSTQGGAVAL